jgi:hypothetical protein
MLREEQRLKVFENGLPRVIFGPKEEGVVKGWFQNLYSSDIISLSLSLSLWLYSPSDLGRFFSFLILYTVGRTPWTEDQPIARPLPCTQDSTNTE